MPERHHQHHHQKGERYAGWNASRGGFRLDWNVNVDQSVTLQGDLYGGKTGRTYGLETVADWHPADRWRLRGAYSCLHIRITPEKGSLDAHGTGPERESPRNQFSIRSTMDFPGKTDLTGPARHLRIRGVDVLMEFRDGRSTRPAMVKDETREP